ncbi:hypothetical protein GPECTOR_1g915 [Gonium pectorale]|uniref:Uncharacterized protein n=1 Tax=Gonium pectorale TaxID=33097 RepID=A0A150H4N1_GONPE|nr:hypothetical protein GPECTOR_1g915 [Gonium pectorale]|eukprot:KXZ57013.1 hypothetical protein GPECTOR_1g915 [Gonium pectorale]
MAAHTSLEDSLALVLSPTQLGAQLWEGAHSASGLPWWAAIPAATLAVRGALLPLSLKAYAASANVTLLHRAVTASRSVAEAVAEADEQRRGERERKEDAAEGDKAEAQSSSGRGGGNGSAVAVGALGRVDLVRRVAAHMRAQHSVPSFAWYLANAAVQVPLAVSLTLALRRMCDSLWPGLTGEGLLYFTDLTAPPVYLQTLSTPFGTAGAILPLGLVLLYVSAMDRSAGGRSPGINIALKLLSLPLYCAALLQPHAVLLYWGSTAACQMGLYAAADRMPALRRAAGVPEGLLAPPAETDDASAADTAVPLEALLLSLAESYAKSGNKVAAAACLEALLTKQPGNTQAEERLRALS